MFCEISISIGELLDKITILKIKLSRLTNQEALINVKSELNILQNVRNELNLPQQVNPLENSLFETNLSLWNVCEQRRNLDREKSFGIEYIDLSKLEYRLNDKRALIKKELNTISKSEIKEEKSYFNFNSKDNYLPEKDLNEYVLKAKKVINDEIHGLIQLHSSIDINFEYFVNKLKNAKGRSFSAV